MKATAGLYRKGKDSVSISVGGRESFERIVDGKKVKEYVNTTVAHELGHALDHKVNLKLFESGFLYERSKDFNPIQFSTRGSSYWQSKKEVTARMIEEYIAVQKGQTAIFTRQGYWNKDIFEDKIKPAVERAIEKHFAEYMKKAEVASPQSKPSFDRNDVVKMTDKETGKVQERTFKRMLEDGEGAVVIDSASGIPMKAYFNKWDIEMLSH